MTRISGTWWGQRFLRALESCTDPGRLQRGRGYAGASRLLAFQIHDDAVRARMRGNVNPYYGVYKEPRYEIEIRLEKIPARQWQTIIERLTENAGWLSRLLLDEVPEDIDQAFANTGHSLLPRSARDLHTQCSCPDWANPCKHVAGAYYHVASLMDRDPFLLFQLRGLSREALHKQLVKSPLGKALAARLREEQTPHPEPAVNRYPPAPVTQAETSLSYKEFWNGKRSPAEQNGNGESGIAALIIRREGDAPPFWPRENSFIEAMSEIYERVQAYNKGRM